MDRLKIALVAHGIHCRGGMERCFAELTRALCHEHNLHLFTSDAADIPFENVTLHPIPVFQRPLLSKFLQFYAGSTRHLRREQFDIIHTIGGITADQTVVTAQYCQHAWGQAIRQEPGAAEGITPYHQLMWRLTGYFEKRAVNSPRTQMIIANSQQTKEDLQKFYGTDPYKIQVIYNAVDPVRFSPANRSFRNSIRQRYGIGQKAIVLLFVGEYRRKGLANIIRALGLLQMPQIHLLAVGQGNREQFAALAAQNGVRAQVTLASSASDIERVFGTADMFVFPTLYEPFGMVITEAMASGLPVITSRHAGAAEWIKEGVNGLLLSNPGDVSEIATCIDRLVSNSSLCHHLRESARASVSGHDWKCAADQTLALYRRIQDPKHQPRMQWEAA